jgi:hypothetical protein
MNYLLSFLDRVREKLNELPEGRIVLAEYKPTTKLAKIRDIRDDEYQTINFIPDYFIQHFLNK